MIIGHGPLAFTITATILLATTKFPNNKILYLATTAGIAAIIPDIDMLLPFASIFTVNTLSITAITNQFWTVSGERHRLATHSLIILTITTLIAFTIQKISTTTAFKPELQHTKQKIATTIITITILFTPLSIPLKLLTTTTLITAYFLTTHKPTNTTTTQLTLAFLIGTTTHPFGDMFTGTPPTFLYPYTNILELTRWTIPNPTIQLTLLFTLEIGTLITTILLLEKLTTTNHLTYDKIKPQPKHLLFGLTNATLITIIAHYYTIPLAPTVDTATKFVLTLVTLTTIINTKTIYKQQYTKYITDTSWTLLTAILTFTIYYTTTQLLF